MSLGGKERGYVSVGPSVEALSRCVSGRGAAGTP